MCHEGLTAPIAGGAGLREDLIEIPGAGRTVPTWFVRPEDGPAPGVVVMHDVWGVNPFYRDLARRLAGEGFAVLLPDFFVREGGLKELTAEARTERRQRHHQDKALGDIEGAMSWLQDNPASTGKVGTLGFCMGGTYVFLAASRQPYPNASVAFYGFPAAAPTPIAPVVAIDEAGAVASPILALWGDRDHGVGMANVERYHEMLDHFGAEHEFVVYPGIGHGFLTFDPEDPRYTTAQEAWQKALGYLRMKLADDSEDEG